MVLKYYAHLIKNDKLALVYSLFSALLFLVGVVLALLTLF